MEEIWKVYKETNSFRNRYGKRIYEVSDQGNVRINGIIIEKFSINGSGYYSIAGFYIHRAVAELFIHNTNNYPCVDHINGDRYDNRAENLRWCTNEMNHNYPLARLHVSKGMKGKPSGFKGKNHTKESIIKLSESHKGLPSAIKGKHRVYRDDGSYYFT